MRFGRGSEIPKGAVIATRDLAGERESEVVRKSHAGRRTSAMATALRPAAAVSSEAK